ncbi:hypothetical protein KAR91_77040 [Candidatus Pacearchaeota archaeon]|nr:hypothetical protein [Candidatus Pacearchaeota archaeon]
MKKLIFKKHKCMLWKDELYDIQDSTKHTFLLLKYAEVYRYTKNTLRLHVWISSKLSQLRKMGVILNEMEVDEHFTEIEVENENLPQLITLGAFKKRPNINGKWIKSKEKILEHRILPYKPVLRD